MCAWLSDTDSGHLEQVRRHQRAGGHGLGIEGQAEYKNERIWGISRNWALTCML